MMVPGGHVPTRNKIFIFPCSGLGSALMVARFLVDAAQLPGDPLAVDGCQLGTVEAAGAVAYSCNKHSPQVPPGGRDHVYFSASLGACPPISVCLSLYIFLYIYRAIRGTGCVWWCFFGGAGLCVCNGGPWLIPSRRPAVIIQGRKKRAPWHGFPLSLIVSRPWA